MKTGKKVLAVLSLVLCFTLMSAATVYADTDGTELQVEQPSTLELQLGSAWAGVAFELKTDSGLYPGTVVVG